ncbi:hypothetical protein M406DRAFT_66031 [Cryphonectria parasitica EP155]|uniref:Nephrocystin 3-like N-terminal domain-containing protein n=1 Tax=Cryphonectria parasitica (strain ATCC 38755 / EP155) TaxID=660469 RepID=A0A9P4YAN7_CRYP1|nr:uncharacterized protein M406DRAFT_66031 [Cryphonectria parasitica EP155]KAF3769541.1 hypothetical protein M406DRAFT_66031 [Cryphonectria parasitica EP155]
MARFLPVSSTQQLMSEINAIHSVSKAKRRIFPILQKIQKFAENLGPYMKVVELASHFVTFFEKLGGILGRLDDKLLRYGQLHDKFKGVRKDALRLTNAMSSIYLLLFQFLAAVARIFTTKEGKRKRTPVVVGTLMWKPFDLHFEEILEGIGFHQETIKEEMDFLIMNHIEAKLSRQEKEAEAAGRGVRHFIQKTSVVHTEQTRNTFLASVVQWLAPPDDFKERLQRAQELRMEGTAEWLFDQDKFVSWRALNYSATHDSDMSSQGAPSILWVNAASTMDELSRQEMAGDSALTVCYYFFSQSLARWNTSSDALRAIALQILHKFHSEEMIYNAFSFALADYPVQTRATEQELYDLLTYCLPHLPTLFCVLDGLDEASDGKALVRSLWKLRQQFPTSLKVIFFSRPEVRYLHHLYVPDVNIKFDSGTSSADIGLYIRGQVEDMVQARLLPLSCNVREVVRNLVNRSEGMFLWARLMVTYLNSPALTRKERLDTMMDCTPDGLESMYRRIHTRIVKQDSPSKDLASRAFSWVAYGSPEVGYSDKALQEALYDNGWDGSSTDFDHVISSSCCSLLEKDANARYRFIHLSALEYVQAATEEITTDRVSLSPLILSKEVAICGILQRYLRYLMKELPTQPLSGGIGADIDLGLLRQQHPLLKYAAPNWLPLTLWIFHAKMQNSAFPPDESIKIEETVQQYLESRLSINVWIEAIYRINGRDVSTFVSDAKSWMLRATRESHRPVVADLEEFVNDLHTLDTSWGESLSRSPSAIWDDVTEFNPSRFWVSTTALSKESLLPSLGDADHHEYLQHNTKPTFSISMSSNDGSRLLVLGIYPPRNFCDVWNGRSSLASSTRRSSANLASDTDHFQLLSIGWVARIEVFSLSSSSSHIITQVEIKLNPQDIRVCLENTLRVRGPGFEKESSTPKMTGVITEYDATWSGCPIEQSSWDASDVLNSFKTAPVPQIPDRQADLTDAAGSVDWAYLSQRARPETRLRERNSANNGDAKVPDRATTHGVHLVACPPDMIAAIKWPTDTCPTVRELNMPLSISPTLETFTILNRIYRLPQGRSGSAEPEQLAMDFSSWVTPVKKGSTSISRSSYRIYWSPDGMWLAFAGENARFVAQKAGLAQDTVVNFSGIAIFSAKNIHERSCLEVLNATTYVPVAGSLSFHPSQPLLLVPSGQYIWKLPDGRPEKFDLANGGNFGNCHKVTFSHCGRFVAIHRSGRDWPQLVPVPAYYLETTQSSKEVGTDVLPSSRDDHCVSAAKDSSNLSTRLVIDQIVPVLRSSESTSLQMSDDIMMTLHTKAGTGGSQFELAAQDSRDDSGLFKIPLLQVPDDLPVTNMSISMHKPASERSEDKISIVLNSTHEGQYKSNEPTLANHLPLVIRKDQRALYLKDKQGGLVGSRDTVGFARLHGALDVDDDATTEPGSKRRKTETQPSRSSCS